MVLAIGEFGRTPRWASARRGNGNAPTAGTTGRLYTALITGGGVPRGRRYGKSDAHGSGPPDNPVHPVAVAGDHLPCRASTRPRWFPTTSATCGRWWTPSRCWDCSERLNRARASCCSSQRFGETRVSPKRCETRLNVSIIAPLSKRIPHRAHREKSKDRGRIMWKQASARFSFSLVCSVSLW